MTTTFTGRLVGGLLLTVLLGGILVNFVLTAPLFGEPGFLEGAAPHAVAIGASALLGIGLSVLVALVAVLAWPVLRPAAPTLALLFVLLAGVGVALAAVEQARVMAMVSLSEAYTAAAPAERQALAALRPVVADARNWAHFSALLVSGATLLAFYLAMLVAQAVPRWLAAAGVVAVLLQLASLALPFLGGEVFFPLLAPLGLVQLVVAGWLLVRGFAEPQPDVVAGGPERR